MSYDLMTRYPHWVLWKSVPVEGEGKARKVPCDMMGNNVSALDPVNWLTYENAASIVREFPGKFQLGFVLNKDNPIWALDIDGCRDKDGVWSKLPGYLLSYIPGALAEVSFSGRGMHGIFSWPNKNIPHAKKNAALSAELYSTDRFIALGDMSTATGDCSTQVDPTHLINAYFAPGDETLLEWRDTPVDEWDGPPDDEVLLAAAAKEKSPNNPSVFRGERFASFVQLWTGDAVALSEFFPPDTPDESMPYKYDASRADNALAMELAYWTGKDHERIHRLMWRSGLVRDKWTAHPTYLRSFTITGAVNRCKTVAGANRKKDISPAPTQPQYPVDFNIPEINKEGVVTPGFQGVIGAEGLREYFRGCIYVRRYDKILMPSGTLITKAVFNSMMGGKTFSMDADSKTTPEAFKAFTQNQLITFPQADNICFRPKLPFQELLFEDGQMLVNTYRPMPGAMMEGDASWIPHHLNKMLPNGDDALILTSYIAACIQYPGVKFTWAPFIQGAEGNGKTLLIKILMYCLGVPYCHSPPAHDLDSQFNSHLSGKLLIALEEVCIKNKWEVMDILKPMITDNRLAITPKGVDQYMEEICFNIIACSNHRDGMPIEEGTRRWAILFTAQQTAEDVERDMPQDAYFKPLWHWLKYENGFAIAHHYFKTFQIPDKYNPATSCVRAPNTTSRHEAITESLSSNAAIIEEAIADEMPGFRGGFVSSKMMTNILASNRTKMGPAGYRKILDALGYTTIPALGKDGRVNNIIAAENAKPRLYAKRGHLVFNWERAVDVEKAYIKAQGYQQLGQDYTNG